MEVHANQSGLFTWVPPLWGKLAGLQRAFGNGGDLFDVYGLYSKPTGGPGGLLRAHWGPRRTKDHIVSRWMQARAEGIRGSRLKPSG